MSNHAGRLVFQVADRPGLARLVRKVVDALHGGSVNRAARRLAKVPDAMSGSRLSEAQRKEVFRLQRSLARFKAGTPERITGSTYETLQRLVPSALHSELEALLMSESALAIHAAYRDWLEETYARSVPVKVPRVRRRVFLGNRVVAPGATSGEDASRDSWASEETAVTTAFREARTKLERQLVQLDAVPEIEGLLRTLRATFPGDFNRLDRLLSERGHTKGRSELAWSRIVSPLLEHSPSSGVERGLREIPKPELRRFLRAGITREFILLQRGSDLARAQGLDRSPRVREAPHNRRATVRPARNQSQEPSLVPRTDPTHPA